MFGNCAGGVAAVNAQESLARLITFFGVVDTPSEAEACIDGISFQF